MKNKVFHQVEYYPQLELRDPTRCGRKTRSM